MKLIVDTQIVRISDFAPKARAAIRKACTYTEAGAEYIRRKLNQPWIGKVCLAKDDSGGITVPIGMLRDVCKVLKKRGFEYKITDVRKDPQKITGLTWNDAITPRPHQIASVAAVTKTGLYYGTGTIKAPIRSGKTITAALAIFTIRVRTTFVVPSKQLVEQTRASLARCLGIPIGVCSDGPWTIHDVNVATTQALCAAKQNRKLDYARLSEKTDMVIVDEVHHMTGKKWNKAVIGLKPRYRIGLSATAYFNETSEIERGVMWVRALCGGIVIDVSVSDMIEAGYLVAPDIYMHTIRNPSCHGMIWGEPLKQKAITKNAIRNAKIVELACTHADTGSRVLIIANRREHITDLYELVKATGKKCAYAFGKTSNDERNDHITNLNSGDTPIVIANVFGEGVDLPIVDVVINAEGGKDPKQTMQRMRNLTACAGKRYAVFHDFYDRTSHYMQEHADARIRMYKSERCFRLHFDTTKEPKCDAKQRISSPCWDFS